MSAKAATLQDAVSRYGKIEGGKWADEVLWCTVITPPKELTWVNTLGATPFVPSHIYCNKDMAPVLLRALENVVRRGLVAELVSFDGCFNIRDVRGAAGKLSAHAYALAIDINAATNRLGETPGMSPELVACFTDVGFDWGGNFARQDGMHFSFCWEGS